MKVEGDKLLASCYGPTWHIPSCKESAQEASCKFIYQEIKWCKMMSEQQDKAAIFTSVEENETQQNFGK
jgi:hypothetical protein